MSKETSLKESGFESLTVTYQENIAIVTLDRPQALNSMTVAFWEEFPRAIRSIDDEGRARVIILQANGKHFSAGMDLQVFNAMGKSFRADPARRAEQMRRKVLLLQDAFNVLERARMPVIAAVHGAAIGGAVDLLCACDMRYCTQDAYFCVKETQLGMTADLGTLQRLPRLISPGLAKELAYTGRNFSAEEALGTGFVNQVFADKASMYEEVAAIAATIAQHSPVAVSGTKTMINYAADHSLHDSLDYMATWQAGMFQMEDIQTAMQAQQKQNIPEFSPLKPGISRLDD